MMIPIALFSLAALAVIIERFITFSTLSFPKKSAVDHFIALAEQGVTAPPDTLPGEEGGPFYELLSAAAGPGDKETRETAAGAAGDALLFSLGRRLDFLSMVGTTAPLMGLLGTVLGMVHVFADVAGAGNAADIALLADGIWQALITTAAGLGVAVPTLIAHGYFVRQMDKAAFWMQQTATRCVR